MKQIEDLPGRIGRDLTDTSKGHVTANVSGGPSTFGVQAHIGASRRFSSLLHRNTALADSGLYIISAVVVITGFWPLNQLSGEWGWFLVGFYIYVIVTGLSIASGYRRVRRKSKKT